MRRSIVVRWALLGLLCLCLCLPAAALAKGGDFPKAKYKVTTQANVMIPMRDGVRLATDIYFPKGVEKAPVLLVRTPYGKGLTNPLGRENFGRRMGGQGYIVVVQDVRGRFKSEGEFYPFLSDGPDGADTIAWIEKQPWSNGRLGTNGGSYLGATQWFESPGQKIDAMHLLITSPRLDEVMFTGGELHLMTVFFWGVMMGEKTMDLAAMGKLPFMGRYLRTLPLSQADDKLSRDVNYFDDALDPRGIYEIYRKSDITGRFNEIQAASVFMAGWYDMFLGPQLRDYQQLLAEGKGKARESVLIVGPWGHGAQGGDKSVDFGPDAGMGKAMTPADTLAWYDHYLRDEDNGVDKWPRVRIFVMGENRWREEKEWPLARTVYTDYFLHSGGAANTCGGDGTLSTAAPAGNEPEDKFTYDPNDPVPTLGGNNLGLSFGPYDQRKVEKRPDVLCYTTAPLTAAVEVTGPITATLYATTDAADTDYTVKLVDVWPDGRAVNIQDGIVRALYRHNNPSQSTPPTPGAVEEYKVDLWATSNLFQAGHRIRVEVSSSNFPRFNRNLNTGEPPTTATRVVVAHQVISHDPDKASRITLPVIPR